MSGPRNATKIRLVLIGNSLAGLLLLASTLCRETPKFWRNAGGYPVWLRHLIQFGHYPLLFLVLGGTLAGSLLARRYLARNQGCGTGFVVVSALQWLLFLVCLVIMLWNNVDNLLHGRPLHYHPRL
jgi:hypothetical protein